MKKVGFLLAALSTSLLVSTAASAAKRTFQADMDPGQENTVPDVGTHNPTGTITVTFDDVTKELCGKIEYTDLTGIASGVHIHRAPAGNPEGDSAPTDKVEIPPTASPVSFNIKLSADFEKALNATVPELYANIHTAANAKGELRSASPWIEDNALPAVPCPPPTVTGGGDAGADAGKSSSSSSGSTTSSGGASSGSGTSSSGSSGDNGDSTGSSTSGSSSTSGKDAGAAAAKKKDDGGCNTTEGETETAPLSFALVLGVAIAALTRGRKKKR